MCREILPCTASPGQVAANFGNSVKDHKTGLSAQFLHEFRMLLLEDVTGWPQYVPVNNV